MLYGMRRGQPLQRARIGDEAANHVRQHEVSALHGNDQIGRKGDLESASDGRTIDGGNHRLPQIPEFSAARKSTGLVHHGIVDDGRIRHARDFLQVPGRAEDPRSGAGHDADAQSRIVAKKAIRFARLVAHLGSDGVRRRPIDRNFERRPATLHAHVLHVGDPSRAAKAVPARLRSLKAMMRSRTSAPRSEQSFASSSVRKPSFR
jgi:hypothetical protein